MRLRRFDIIKLQLMRGFFGIVLLTALLVSCRTQPEESKVDGKILLFAIDGATWDIIDPLLEEGELPNLSRLIKSGARAPMITLTPTISPPIWTSIITGVYPDKHKITDFVTT